MGVALYPGSFDPIHYGHIGVIETASSIFDSLIVGVAENSQKRGLIPPADRVELIKQSIEHLSNVDVMVFSGLTIDQARKLEVSCLLKGVRNASNFDDEMIQAAMNESASAVKTLFVPGYGAYGLLSSRFVREISAKGGDVSSSVPPHVVNYLHSRPSRQV